MGNLTRRSSSGYADPWRDFFELDLFGDRLQGKNSFPAVNICEDGHSYMVDVVAPGFKKEDFRINMEDDILTISAESRQENTEQDGKRYSRREYSYSAFTRSFHLPDNAKDDAIAARYVDGVLKITIPKAQQEQKPSKQINIE